MRPEDAGESVPFVSRRLPQTPFSGAPSLSSFPAFYRCFIFTATLFQASRRALSTCAAPRAVIPLCCDASDAYLRSRACSCRFSRSLLLTEAVCVFVAVRLPTCISVCGNSASVVFLHRRCCLQFACPFSLIVLDWLLRLYFSCLLPWNITSRGMNACYTIASTLTLCSLCHSWGRLRSC